LLGALKVLDGALALAWKSVLPPEDGTGSPPNGDLTGAHNRLFVGPLPPLAHPYESVYRTPEARLMGEVTTQVRRAYAEAGLAIAEECRQLPDHLTIELEFMAFLANEEANALEQRNDDLACAILERQAAFLRDHLTRWVPEFSHRVVSAGESDFYSTAATTLAAFVVQDLARTQARLQGLRGDDESHDREPPKRPVGEWSVVVRRERPSHCTLCRICTEVCRPAALRMEKNRWEVALVFDSAQCDGCGYCVEYCPERILRVEPTTAQHAVPKDAPEQLAHSAILPCTGCGNPLVAEAMLAKVLERFRRQKGDPEDEASMYLCHSCKLGAIAGV
jgi:TorA maturation chaperone TorD/Pyruvate/2-oxoacid:ferredoxin oxidoreductase delta subunit